MLIRDLGISVCGRQESEGRPDCAEGEVMIHCSLNGCPVIPKMSIGNEDYLVNCDLSHSTKVAQSLGLAST